MPRYLFDTDSLLSIWPSAKGLYKQSEAKFRSASYIVAYIPAKADVIEPMEAKNPFSFDEAAKVSKLQTA